MMKLFFDFFIPELFTTIDIHNKDSIINGFCERVQKLLQLDDDKLPNISLETCEQAVSLNTYLCSFRSLNSFL